VHPVEKNDEQRLAVLDALGTSLSIKCREWVAARASSGIEKEWEGDEEHYQGYDDANRSEFVNTTTKSNFSGEKKEAETVTGSTVFPNITQQYVDAAAARVGDMLLPTDDRNFALEATPIPDMGLDQFPDESDPVPAQQPPQGMPPMGAQPPADPMAGMAGQPPAGMPPPQGQPGPMLQMPDGAVVAVAEAKAKFAKMKAEAERKADKAQDRIDDWLTESQYHAEMRLAIDDAAKLGSGVIKGPVPVKRKSKKWTKGEDGVSRLEISEEIKPGSFRVDPWNLFPDAACGASIHNGSGIFERDYLSEKKLKELIGLPGYIKSQIEKCIEEGTKNDGNSDRQKLGNTSVKGQYEIWYYHGDIKTEELKAAGIEFDDEDTKKTYPAMLTMVNDRVIRASLNPLDSGEFPYDVIPWKRRPGMPWGMGVARQMRTPQRIVVAATRNLMDNAGLASGPQLVLRRGVEPENGIWEICPLKVWREGDDAPAGQAGAPFLSVVIPMLQAELMAIIQWGQKMAEDVTGLPMLLQGQQGGAPNTVGGMTILNNNANAVLRRIARLFDSCITEPHIRRYYAWLMEYGDDDDEKGDFQIVARGSTALVERDIQSQEMVNILQLCLNPAFKKNPAKAMDEYLKSRRFDPAAFDYSEEELAQMAQQQPPEDPRIGAAKIMAGQRDAEAKMRAQSEQGRVASAQTMQDKLLEFDKWEKEIDVKLAIDGTTSEEKRDLDKLKTEVATLAMKLKVQQELTRESEDLRRRVALAGHTVDLHKNRQVMTPPTEPIGRAQPGSAFTQ